MSVLDPLATFLLRVQEAGDDVDPVAALFGGGEASAQQRELADRFVRRAHDEGYVETSGPAGATPTRVTLTADGRRYLTERDL